MSRTALLTGLFFLATVQSSAADPWPHRMPGLWQSTTTVEGMSMGAMNSKFCIDLATEAAMMNFGRHAADKACGAEQVHVSGNTGTIDATCKFGAMTSISHTVVTFHGNTAVHTEIHSKMLPPPKYGPPEHTTISDSKWVGPCPAGMKPGDMTMANGMTMHLKP